MNNFFYDIQKKLAAIDTGKRSLTESANPGVVPSHLDEEMDEMVCFVSNDDETTDLIDELFVSDGTVQWADDYESFLVPREHYQHVLDAVEENGGSIQVVSDSEQLDELSKDTLKNYVDKRQWDMGANEKAQKKMDTGLSRAEKKIKGKEENLNELSKKTLGSYVKKAAQDSQEAAYSSAADYERGYDARHLRGLEHADKRQRGIERAVDKMTNERAGPVSSGGGTWQSQMHLEEGDIESLISDLRKAYAHLDTIDPASPVYKKLITFLDNLDREHLQVLADAGVKFVSMLAKNRLRSGADKLNELSKDTLKSYKDKSRAREHEIMKNHEYGTQRGRQELGKRVKGQMDANRAVDRLTRESYDDWGLESMDDVINVGLSMLNDGMPIRDILNMFQDEGFVESDKEVRELISALKNKGGSAMESRKHNDDDMDECSMSEAYGYRYRSPGSGMGRDQGAEQRANKMRELSSELGHEGGNGWLIWIDGRYWKSVRSEAQAEKIADTLRARGKKVLLTYGPLDESAQSYDVVFEHKGKTRRVTVDMPRKKR